MVWETKKLGAVLSFQRGFDITKATQKAGPYPVISSSGKNSFHCEFMARGPGVIIGRKGTLGTVFYEEGHYWPHDTTLWVKDFHDNNPLFSYYFLKTMEFSRYDVGASNPTLNRNHIHLLEILWPDVPIQRRIASILSAYDDLIENNRKRIAILEEMARRLYREWFVHFRYPGHETVPLVDSPLGRIPQGWKVRRLLDVAGVVYGFPFGSQAFNTNGIGLPVVRIRDVLDGESKTFTAEKPEQKHYLNNGDILVGMDGDFHIGAWSGSVAVQNQRVARFVPISGGFSRGLLIQAIRVPIETLNHQIVGATVGHLGDMHIRKIDVVVPPPALRVQVETQLDAMFDLAINLRCQISTLRRTRDLLLPRLMSGTLSVEALATVEATAP